MSDLARSFSMHDADRMQHPDTFYDEMRSKCPVAHSDELGGFYFVTSYDAARRVYDDFRTYSSADGTALPKQPLPLYPIDLDPPHQTKLRRVLNPLFLPEVIHKYQPRMQVVIDELIDGFIARGEVELQEELIRPMLAIVILPFLGTPLSDRTMLAHKMDYLTRRRADDPETCARYGEEIGAYLLELTAKRRESPPQDDIMQVLIDSRINGQPLTDMEIMGIATLVLFGGLDTTSGALGEAMYHLIRTPHDVERLMSGEVPFPRALDEFVRYASPVQGLRRTVTKDTVLEGCPLKAGDFVFSMNGGGNHDPEQFEEPQTIRIDRDLDQHDHLGFGAGAHICLGQHFARTLMETLIRSVFTRLPGIRIVDGFVPAYAVGESRVMKVLPVTFTPGAPLA